MGAFASADRALAVVSDRGKIVRHGRQIFLQIGAAMLDMFAAIRERCARIMREGGAIPETS